MRVKAASLPRGGEERALPRAVLTEHSSGDVLSHRPSVRRPQVQDSPGSLQGPPESAQIINYYK